MILALADKKYLEAAQRQSRRYVGGVLQKSCSQNLIKIQNTYTCKN